MPALTRVGTAFFLGKKSGGGGHSGTTTPGGALFHADKGSQDPTWSAFTTYNWVVPAGVERISFVCVGGGGSGCPRHDGPSGSGGGLAYKNNLVVTPGSTILVTVGGGGGNLSWGANGNHGESSWIEVGGTAYALAGGGRGGTYDGVSGFKDNTSYGSPGSATDKYDGGGKGGRGYEQSGCRQSGGGAGGYSNSPDNGNGAEGGDCGNPSYAGTTAVAGANGAGGGGNSKNGSTAYYASGGGGVGMYGRGVDGTKGDPNNNDSPDNQTEFAGGGGSWDPWNTDGQHAQWDNTTGMRGYSSDSSWTDWANPLSDLGNGYRRDQSTQGQGQTRPDGGFPGGGAGGGNGGSPAGYGGHGCVRIIWGQAYGASREFPITGVDRSDLYAGGQNETVYGRQMMY